MGNMPACGAERAQEKLRTDRCKQWYTNQVAPVIERMFQPNMSVTILEVQKLLSSMEAECLDHRELEFLKSLYSCLFRIQDPPDLNEITRRRQKRQEVLGLNEGIKGGIGLLVSAAVQQMLPGVVSDVMTTVAGSWFTELMALAAMSRVAVFVCNRVYDSVRREDIAAVLRKRTARSTGEFIVQLGSETFRRIVDDSDGIIKNMIHADQSVELSDEERRRLDDAVHILSEKVAAELDAQLPVEGIPIESVSAPPSSKRRERPLPPPLPSSGGGKGGNGNESSMPFKKRRQN